MLQMKWGIKSVKMATPRPTKDEFHRVGTREASLLEELQLS
jgi:hypothetical protein